MRKNYVLLLVGLAIKLSVYAQFPVKNSAKEVQADLSYLKEAMEASNYNFYALTDKSLMDQEFLRVQNSIQDSLSDLQVFRLFQPYVALAGMSHCYIDYPWTEYGQYLKLGGTLFPLRLYFNEGKVLVRSNFSQNNEIEENDEILMMNGMVMQTILNKMHRYISGPTQYFKNSQIEQKEFARLYWFFFDTQESFALKIKKTDGRELDLMVESIKGSAFDERIRHEESLLRVKREFKLLGDIAYLKPGHFLNDIPFNPSDPALMDNTEFCHFTDSAFSFFRERKAESLIIDLRYNPGGDNSFSDYMISYFADKPFWFASRFSVKTSQITKEHFRKLELPEVLELKNKILSLEDGTVFDLTSSKVFPHADSIRFKGKVYVLINRYSYSNTSSVAAVIQDYKFGEIIGEETAEVVSSYGGVHTFMLPNSNYTVTYPKALMVRPNGDVSQRGVIPDYPINEDIHSIQDDVLEYTLELIEGKYNAKPYKVLEGHKHKVQGAFFSQDGKYIISYGWDNTVKIWDVKTFTEIRSFEGHTDQVWHSAISHDNKLLASGSMDRTFIIWDIESGEKLHQIQISPSEIVVKGLIPEMDYHIPNSIYRVAFSPNGKHLAIASADKLVRIWDLGRNAFTATLNGKHNTNWMWCRYSPDGKYLISASSKSSKQDGVKVIWEADAYKQIKRIAMSGSILFTDNNELGIYSGNNTMNYYDLSDGTFVNSKTFPDFKGNFNLSPDKKFIVSCNEDSFIILRNVKTQKVVWTYQHEKLEIHSANFSPDGKYLIAGTPEGNILVWEMESLPGQ